MSKSSLKYGVRFYLTITGFASLTAEIETEDNNLIDQLMDIKNKKTVVSFKCAMLEVTGSITNGFNGKRGSKFIISVQNVLCHKPNQPWEG